MSAVTIKGQVTIPKPVRDKLGLRPGDEVAFDLTSGDQVVIRKAKGGKAKPGRVAKLRGLADAGLTTDQIMALTRGE